MENTENTNNERLPVKRRLSKLHIGVLLGAAVPMIAVGGVGAWGTITNIQSEFPDKGTAFGVVAAGEGGTLILALVMVLVTLLGQSSPRMLRLGLWLLPLVASGTGAVVADDLKERVVYAITPLAMIAAAEGLGLIARRVVIYCTGVDMEARRRNATTMQRMAVLRAKAANHPWGWYRKCAEIASWRLASKVGVGDDELGADLVTVQRERLTEGADTALAGMFALPVTPAVTQLGRSVTPELEPGALRDGSVTPAVTDDPARHGHGTDAADTVTKTVAQVSAETDSEASQAATTVTATSRDAVTDTGADAATDAATVTDQPVTAPASVTGEAVTDGKASQATVTLAEVAAVAGVPVPETGERLSDEQLVVVLRHLRYREDPPLSYRQAVAAFREAGFVGGEERIRRTWGELMSREENDATEAKKTAEESKSSHTDDDANADEEDEEEAGPRS